LQSKQRRYNLIMYKQSTTPSLILTLMKSIPTKLILIFILILTPAINIALLQGYTNAAQWLYVRSPLPEKIDYLCSFAGNESRDIYALQLYKRYKPVWIASTSDRKYFLMRAYRNGVDTSKIIVTDKCESTLDEIRFFKSQINKFHLSEVQNLAFVSSPLHMRRILVYNSIVNHNNRLHIYSLPVSLEQSALSETLLNEWQKNKDVRDMVNFELIKMVGGIISSTPFFGPWFNENIEERVKKRVFG
jgi:uncharacterized SAM-binding protein YcdF (DUF218 family)